MQVVFWDVPELHHPQLCFWTLTPTSCLWRLVRKQTAALEIKASRRRRTSLHSHRNLENISFFGILFYPFLNLRGFTQIIIINLKPLQDACFHRFWRSTPPPHQPAQVRLRNWLGKGYPPEVLTASKAPENIPKPKRKGSSSKHPFFRGELLNFGGGGW